LEAEGGADVGALLAGADHVEVGAIAQSEAQCVQHDGLAGAGLTGDGSHPGLEFQVELGNEGEVLNRELYEHKAGGVFGLPDCSGSPCKLPLAILAMRVARDM